MNKTASAKYYISTNDIEGAIYRLENALPRYKKHWFDTAVTIINNVKEFIKQYIIDPINMVIHKILPEKKSFTYLIKMYDENNNHVFTKIGMTDNINRRMKELSNHFYVKENIKIHHCEIIKSYQTNSHENAEILESCMRKYLKTKYRFIPNDRFLPFDPSIEDLQKFEYFYNFTKEI